MAYPLDPMMPFAPPPLQNAMADDLFGAVPPDPDLLQEYQRALADAQGMFPQPEPMDWKDRMAVALQQGLQMPVTRGSGGGNFIRGLAGGYAASRLAARKQMDDRKAEVSDSARKLALSRWEAARKAREEAITQRQKFGVDVEKLKIGERIGDERQAVRNAVDEKRRLAAEARANKEFDRRARLTASLRPKPSLASKPATMSERQAMAFYLRANDAISSLTSPGPNGEPSLEDKIGKSPVGQAQINWLPNIFKPADAQSYTQAQRAFTEARLRKESGAAIAEHEYKNDARIYFAQPGDKPNVIEQKRRKRQQVLNGLKFSAGKAYREFYEGQPQQTMDDGMTDEEAFEIAREEGLIK